MKQRFRGPPLLLRTVLERVVCEILVLGTHISPLVFVYNRDIISLVILNYSGLWRNILYVLITIIAHGCVCVWVCVCVMCIQTFVYYI